MFAALLTGLVRTTPRILLLPARLRALFAVLRLLRATLLTRLPALFLFVAWARTLLTGLLVRIIHEVNSLWPWLAAEDPAKHVP
jgi:hypothetical protein